MSDLVPCPACKRHVRRDEPACPFCGAPITAAGAPPSARTPPPRAVTLYGAPPEPPAAPVYGAPPGLIGGPPSPRRISQWILLFALLSVGAAIVYVLRALL